MDDAAAFILTGGQSSRMGTDKAFLPFGPHTLLECAIAVVRQVVPQWSIVGPAEKFAPFGNTVEDIYRNRGPLGGIHAALRGSGRELNLILGVDLPNVTPALLEFLLDRARRGTALATVPQSAGRLQPLCAVYRSAFGEAAQAALREGRNKIEPLLTEVRAHVIPQAELEAFAFPAILFENLNTPEDYERFRRQAT